jgi:hypothetical protein
LNHQKIRDQLEKQVSRARQKMARKAVYDRKIQEKAEKAEKRATAHVLRELREESKTPLLHQPLSPPPQNGIKEGSRTQGQPSITRIH